MCRIQRLKRFGCAVVIVKEFTSLFVSDLTKMDISLRIDYQALAYIQKAQG